MYSASEKETFNSGENLFVFHSSAYFLVCFLVVLYYLQARDRTLELLVDKARVICKTADATRLESELEWDKGIFSVEQLLDWKKEGRDDKIWSAIPVVIAWNSAMRIAHEDGYHFKTPKFNPRNPKNEPTHLEARSIQKIKTEHLEEYYEIDESTNRLHFFLPIYLSQTCLVCHGDPKTSKELWGNDYGLDITGHKMEGWNKGEIHGAFEVIQSLDEFDEELYQDIKVILIKTSFVIVLMSIHWIFDWTIHKTIY